MPNTAVNERKSLSQFPLKSHGLHTIMNRTSRFGRRKNISTDPKCGSTKASYDDEALFNFKYFQPPGPGFKKIVSTI